MLIALFHQNQNSLENELKQNLCENIFGEFAFCFTITSQLLNGKRGRTTVKEKTANFRKKNCENRNLLLQNFTRSSRFCQASIVRKSRGKKRAILGVPERG
jgi:hypothetical protein